MYRLYYKRKQLSIDRSWCDARKWNKGYKQTKKHTNDELFFSLPNRDLVISMHVPCHCAFWGEMSANDLKQTSGDCVMIYMGFLNTNVPSLYKHRDTFRILNTELERCNWKLKMWLPWQCDYMIQWDLMNEFKQKLFILLKD